MMWQTVDEEGEKDGEKSNKYRDTQINTEITSWLICETETLVISASYYLHLKE